MRFLTRTQKAIIQAEFVQFRTHCERIQRRRFFQRGSAAGNIARRTALMGRSMTKQIASIVKATLLVGAGLFIPGLSGLPAGAAAECLLAPSGLSPQGQHWYYRFDRINQRKCWYLRAPTQAVRHAEPNVTPSVEPPTEALPVLRKESVVTTPAAPPPLERPAWPAPRIDANQEADATPWVERGPLQTNNSDSRGFTPTLSSPRSARANDALC
jgi:hypothetical protein